MPAAARKRRIENLKTHGDLNARCRRPRLVWFGGAYESLQLPTSESDTREAAWFTKLDHIWQRDVLTNKIAWIQAKKQVRLGADLALMPAREGEEVPYSEPSSIRLLWQHEYSALYGRWFPGQAASACSGSTRS